MEREGRFGRGRRRRTDLLPLASAAAPVQDVLVSVEGGSLTCQVKGVYPPPNLTWSSEPAQQVLHLHNETRSYQDQLGFYHISSWLGPAVAAAAGNRSQSATFTCHVTSGQDKKSASIRPEGEDEEQKQLPAAGLISSDALCCSSSAGVSRGAAAAPLSPASQLPSNLQPHLDLQTLKHHPLQLRPEHRAAGSGGLGALEASHRRGGAGGGTEGGGEELNAAVAGGEA